jgi:hypothetical protein
MSDLNVIVVIPRVVNGVAYAELEQTGETAVITCNIETEGVLVQEVRAIVLRPDSKVPDTPPEQSVRARLDRETSNPGENRMSWRFDNHDGQDRRLEVSENKGNVLVSFSRINDQWTRNAKIQISFSCSPDFTHEVTDPLVNGVMPVIGTTITISGRTISNRLIARVRVIATTTSAPPSPSDPGWVDTKFVANESKYKVSVSGLSKGSTYFLWVKGCDQQAGGDWKDAENSGIKFTTQ